MATITPTPPPVRKPVPLSETRSAGRTGDRIFRVIASLGGIAVLVILALILWSTTTEAWPWFREEGLAAVFSNSWNPASNEFGALALVWGTLLTSLLALLFAVPVSVMIALFVTEVAPRWLQRPMVYVLDLLAAIPSVVFGLWVLLVLVDPLGRIYQDVADLAEPVPLLGTILSGNPVTGRSIMTAGLILAIMITPIVTSVSREVFATTPQGLKDGARAFGATRWEMIRAAVFPHSRSGVVAGVMIGLGRAMGETIAVALVIGSSPQLTVRLFGSGDTMAANIANNFGEATGTFRAALIGLGVVLFVMTLLIGMAARLYVARAGRRLEMVR